MVRTFGLAPGVFTLETYEPGQPGPGHVRVRMTAHPGVGADMPIRCLTLNVIPAPAGIPQAPAISPSAVVTCAIRRAVADGAERFVVGSLLAASCHPLWPYGTR
jgi:hypothetical protein